MSDLREAAQQALEVWDGGVLGSDLDRAMEALRAALEQPDPVAAEREACAKVCDALVRELAPQGREALVAGICAAAIRARGQA